MVFTHMTFTAEFADPRCPPLLIRAQTHRHVGLPFSHDVGVSVRMKKGSGPRSPAIGGRLKGLGYQRPLTIVLTIRTQGPSLKRRPPCSCSVKNPQTMVDSGENEAQNQSVGPQSQGIGSLFDVRVRVRVCVGACAAFACDVLDLWTSLVAVSKPNRLAVPSRDSAI